MARHVLPGVKELDIRGHTSSVAERMNALPGFKTSAAFFFFLRANLVLPPSTLNSTTSTPSLDPSSSQTLPPLGPSSLATMSSGEDDVAPPPNPLDGIPALTTATLTEEGDKVDALKLVADSIAQQRQFASSAVIFHPVTIAAYILLMGIVSQLIYKTRSDVGIMATTAAGVTMACLVGVRSLTGGYLGLAEALNWAFIKNEDGDEDIIIGSRFGSELIGAAIVRLERSGSGGGGKKKAKSGKTGGKGLVRAWTVKLRYRGKGVGTELLEEAVRATREKLGNAAEIGFAVEHANSQMILPELFNGGFRKREVKAARALEAVIDGMDTGSKKKR